HWRDNNGHEVDFIVTLDDGRWGAFEAKLNPKRIDEAANSLHRFAAKVDTAKTGAPAFLGVITAGGFSYQRDDKVAVLNIGALGP
ncbi:MAG: ATP-binding protein, partial [Nocardioidaceae bacterium]